MRIKLEGGVVAPFRTTRINDEVEHTSYFLGQRTNANEPNGSGYFVVKI